jgi:CheY-like chemotaxis protein
MPFDCLAVTCDLTLLGQIRSAFSTRGSLDLRKDAASAVELASRRHLDGIIIDCDDIAEGVAALAEIRNSHSNKQTPIVAVVNGATSVEGALELGANFVIGKPISEGRLQNVLDVAIPKMEREHRRYFRYEIGLPVRLHNDHGQSFPTKMKNISEGGLATRRIDPLSLDGLVIVEFDIPSVPQHALRAKAEVIWSDSFATGLRFLYIERESAFTLRQWLSSLEAQSQLRE